MLLTEEQVKLIQNIRRVVNSTITEDGRTKISYQVIRDWVMCGKVSSPELYNLLPHIDIDACVSIINKSGDSHNSVKTLINNLILPTCEARKPTHSFMWCVLLISLLAVIMFTITA